MANQSDQERAASAVALSPYLTESGRVTTVRRVFEVQRFIHEDHERGLKEGWCLYGDWYQQMSGLVWAWFRREVEDEET